MKTTPHKQGKGKTKEPVTLLEALKNKKAAAKFARKIAREIGQARKAGHVGSAAKQPRYGEARFDTPGLHYAVTDPVPPVNDGGKVKLDLAAKKPTELVNFTYAHIADMTGNENFLTPAPPAADFKTLADQLAASVTAQTNAMNAMKLATSARDTIITQMLQAFKVRGAYVQQASNGNSDVILSSGLSLWNPRTPTGNLPPPDSLAVTLNGTPGVMEISWKAVTKARGYTIQYSPADTMERNWTVLATLNKTKFTATNMEIGKAYAFQVAANGGANGQSFWTVEVVRTAA